ncbi:poly(A) polymerase [Quadrisphaera granulorum]|uniref:Poly(A) polymerase n=1 Tax=Quadrisphaera granulorum TaxID=317664 RepID=A0A316ADC0_9ACTN|nr:CCA tRNA nucleotidyltransferase [Quadrisphaera granulorum]PWJ55776.1 poly(A) polymerase [Quadrisphaera granulorum]SZE95273.1 poly(A) polymerase [Quadrisphaera granulorum]
MNGPIDKSPQGEPSGERSDAVVAAERRVLEELARVAPAAAELGRRFAAEGHELALVGGSVRDALLDRLGGEGEFDLDFATSARPEQTERILAAWGSSTWDAGRAFGTIGARARSAAPVVVEVTTYRSDVYDPESRKPVVAFGDTLEGDLSRRDFTVNAMALHLPDGVFVDPFDGLEDLAAGYLRTPIAPERSFDDDPLRMMRGARFAAQLGFDLAPDALAAAAAMASRLSIVSAERVQAELVKLLRATDPVPGLRVLVDAGLAAVVLPELPALQLEVDEHHRHKDVYEHSLTVLRQAIELEPRYGLNADGPDVVLRLAALLHDIGKPPTRRFEPGGGVSFHHHEVVGAKMTARRLKELKFDKETTKQVARLVELHLRFHGYGGGTWTDSAVRRYVTDAGPLLPRLHALTRADSTTRNKRRAEQLQRTYDDLEDRIAAIREQEQLDAVRPELDGAAIMRILGVKPGPVVGRAYKHLLQVRLDDGLLGEDGARAELLRWWAEQPESQTPDA